MDLQQRWFYTVLITFLYTTVYVSPSAGLEIFSSGQGQSSIGLDIAGKWTSLATHAPEDPELYPDRDSLT